MIRQEAQLELELVERELAEHGRIVFDGLRRAVGTFGTQGHTPAAPTEQLERCARAAHVRIDAAASRLLAERWEISAEARRAVAARRVNDELRGVAELALAIARLARPAAASTVRASRELEELAQLVEAALHEALRAYACRSLPRAGAVAEYDALVEASMPGLCGSLGGEAARHPNAREWALRALLAARCLRRMSHHAMRIAAQTGFLASGTVPDPDPPPARRACRAF